MLIVTISLDVTSNYSSDLSMNNIRQKHVLNVEIIKKI